MAEALARWTNGEATADDVAWAFVRARVHDPTPSFSWHSADLGRLVALTAEAAREPEITARTVGDLAPELDELRRDEEAQWRKVNQAFAKQVKALKLDWGRTFSAPILDAKRLGLITDALKPYSEISKSVDLLSQSKIQAIGEQLEKQVGLSSMSLKLIDELSTPPLIQTKPMLDQLKHLGLASSLAEKIDINLGSLVGQGTLAMPKIETLAGSMSSTQVLWGDLFESQPIRDLLGNKLVVEVGQSLDLEKLRSVATAAAKAARESAQEHAASALENSAEVLRDLDRAESIEVIQEAVKPLLDEAVQAVKENEPNPWLLLILGVILGEILNFLMTQLGLFGGTPPTP